MTAKFAAVVLVLFLGILAADHYYWHINVPVLLGRWILSMTDWLAIWRG